MPQPNVKQGQGRLRRRRQEAREAYLRSRGNAQQDAQNAGNEARVIARGGYSGDQVTKVVTKRPDRGPASPAQPKYGPAMTRARADADLVYGDAVLRAKAGVQNAGSWWDQYKQDVANQQQATAARYAQAQQAVATSAPTVGPAVQTPEGDQAAASRGVMQQAFGNLLTAQGAAQQDYLGGRMTVGSAQQLQSRVQGDAQVQQLARERDAFTVQQRGKYRDQRHQRRLENAAFGLDRAKAAADVADAADDLNKYGYSDSEWANLPPAKKDRIRKRGGGGAAKPGDHYGFTDAQWAKMTPAEKRAAYKAWQAAGRAPGNGADGKNPFSPKDQAKSRQTFRKVFQDIKKNDNGIDTYGKDIQKTLTAAGADSLLVRAAWQLYNRGRVTGGLAKALKRDYGITVKPRSPRNRPEPYSPPADSPGSDAAQG
jgi:hypothetical protein